MNSSISDFNFTGNAVELIPNAYRFTQYAMATVFEIFIVHEDAQYAEQAATEAFRELDLLEKDLSRFIENSDISRINVAKPMEHVVLGEAAFECLKHCIQLYDLTGGAFDVTVGHLMNCWLDENKKLRQPTPEELQFAKEHTGLQHLILDEWDRAAIVLKAPLHLDLGGYGKGYAVDQMAKLLLEWEVDVALVHGGSSSVLALEAPPELPGWPLTLSLPETGEVITRIYLKNRALSGSGVQKGHHIIDPRKFAPVQGTLATWVIAPDAATADALSTAFMIMNFCEIEELCKSNPEFAAIVVSQSENNDDKFHLLKKIGNWE